MPGKKGKGKKGKGKKKAKKPKGMLENPGDIVKRLQRVYIKNCEDKKSVVCPGLKKFMKDCFDDNRLAVKVSLCSFRLLEKKLRKLDWIFCLMLQNVGF